MSLRSEFRVEMSNILSYHMSLRSEFRVEMSNILSYHMSLRSEFCVVMYTTISACSVRLYLQLFVVGLMYYLRQLCLFA